jgi:hypothetical protein
VTELFGVLTRIFLCMCSEMKTAKPESKALGVQRKLIKLLFTVAYTTTNTTDSLVAIANTALENLLKEKDAASRALELLKSVSTSDYEHGQLKHFTATNNAILVDDEDTLHAKEVRTHWVLCKSRAVSHAIAADTRGALQQSRYAWQRARLRMVHEEFSSATE